MFTKVRASRGRIKLAEPYPVAEYTHAVALTAAQPDGPETRAWAVLGDKTRTTLKASA